MGKKRRDEDYRNNCDGRVLLFSFIRFLVVYNIVCLIFNGEVRVTLCGAVISISYKLQNTARCGTIINLDVTPFLELFLRAIRLRLIKKMHLIFFDGDSLCPPGVRRASTTR